MVFHIQRRRDDQGAYILVRNRTRWVLLTLVNLSEIVLYFSFAYLTWGTQFEPLINTRPAAIFGSLAVFVTIGGSTPASDAARSIIMLQVGYFVFFLIVVAPVVLSVIRAKERTKEILGEDIESDRTI